MTDIPNKCSYVTNLGIHSEKYDKNINGWTDKQVGCKYHAYKNTHKTTYVYRADYCQIICSIYLEFIFILYIIKLLF